MKVLIAGVDGYLGWSLAVHLLGRGHEVSGVDNFKRRAWVEEMGSNSAFPILNMPDRMSALLDHFGTQLKLFVSADLTDYKITEGVVDDVQPDVIVHLAEMPSAPYSMIDNEHCLYTHRNNLFGTLNLLFAMRDKCPEAHLLKLGTMGEYGTPNVDIPEGFFEIEYRGRKDTLPFPRQAGSWYHQTKVHDTNNVMFACKMWGLRATDIMQGVVFGINQIMVDNPKLTTRFDFDQSFGTAINRFCAQAVAGMPLTPYGKGHQKRGFLPLCDSMQCFTLAIENPPGPGEYRVFNQFENVYDVTKLAQAVKDAASEVGISATIHNLVNPRKEAEQHYYNPDNEGLKKLGYKPTSDMRSQLITLLTALNKRKDRILAYKYALIPDIRWDGSRSKCQYVQ